MIKLFLRLSDTQCCADVKPENLVPDASPDTSTMESPATTRSLMWVSPEYQHRPGVPASIAGSRP
jgi:hypothetical protein